MDNFDGVSGRITLEKITINGITIEIVEGSYVISKDRYNDGIDYHYFEVIGDLNTDIQENATHYHEWSLENTDNKLNGWLIPINNIVK